MHQQAPSFAPETGATPGHAERPSPDSHATDASVRAEVTECLVIGRAELAAARAKIRTALAGETAAPPDAAVRQWLIRHLALVEDALRVVRQSDL